ACRRPHLLLRLSPAGLARRCAPLREDPSPRGRSLAFAPVRSHPDQNRSGVGGFQIAIAGKRPKREEFRVAVVAQIEDAGETGRGEARLGPEAVCTLLTQKVVDATLDRGMVALC